MPSTVITTTFTGMNLTDARAKVLRKLRQADTTRYSPTKGTADYTWIDDCINGACQTFTMKSRCLRTYAIMQLKSTYRTYKAPYGFIDIASAYLYHNDYTNGYESLQIKSIAELNNEYSDWRTDTDEKPTIIYVDRSHGTDSVLGLYPIPNTDGTDPAFTATTADDYDWVCPLYTNAGDYGMIIQSDGTNKYILPSTTNAVVADVDVSNGNVLLEYYRLPMELLEADQDLEIPYAYQDVVLDMAVAELLENNPEDSNEMKRSMTLDAKAGKTIEDYKKEAKVPMSGRNLRALTAIEGYVKNMDFRRSTY